ncbi:SHOCT domain-containing protein [Gordonia sp. NPDC003424]
MPGLIRAAARTAVIAGTATSVSNRVSRRQGRRWAEQEAQQEAHYAQKYAPPPQQQYAPPPQQQYAAPAAAPAGGADDRISQLQKLAELKSQGILSDQEFAAEKARILGS